MKENTRLARNECLKCGEPLMRIDSVPCCSACWDKVMKSYHNRSGTKKNMRWQNKGNYVKIFPVKELR